jgi:hypothetical protein
MDDSIEGRGLRAKIREYIAGKYRTFTVTKVMRIMDGFPSIDAFCAADKGSWLMKYRASRPHSKHDIGRVCGTALEDVVAFVWEYRRNEELNRQAAERAEREAKAAAEAERRKEEEEEERRNPKFTLAELKSLIAFMDLCSIAAIDLKGIKHFLALIDAKVKEDKQ